MPPDQPGGSTAQRAATKSMKARVRAGNWCAGDQTMCTGWPGNCQSSSTVFQPALVEQAAHLPKRGVLIAVMGLGAILLDAGTIADQALGRHAVNLLRGEARGRINGLYTGVFFLGGSMALALDPRGDAAQRVATPQPVRACD